MKLDIFCKNIIFLLLLLTACTQSATVIKVIDGDTLTIETGEKVRLICIDTPEKNEKGFEEAKSFLESLVLNKKVELEKDITNKDRYGRLLRYVYIDDLFVNKEIVQKGYGKIYRYEPDIKRCGKIDKIV